MPDNRDLPPNSWSHNTDPELVSRSTFVTRVALGAGTLTVITTELVRGTLSSLVAAAAPRNALSIGSSMPAVSKIGQFLGSVTSLKRNNALAYRDPKTGDPALVVRLANGALKSYDAVCPHQGCTVGYDPARNLIVCPCHGASFDPMRNAAPISGPVNQPLISLPIRVDSGGNLYALDAKPGAKVNHLRPAPAVTGGGSDDNGGDDNNQTGDDDGKPRSGRTKGGHHHHGDD